MKLTLSRPVVFFDIESTGLDIVADAIAELSFVKVTPSGEIIEKTWRVRPWNYETNVQLPMNPSASEVNGIHDEDLKDCPRFFELAPEIADMLEDSDLGGYNSAKFDLPMLAEEFEKVKAAIRKGNNVVTAFYFGNLEAKNKLNIDFHAKKMIDVQTIYFKMEPRNLKAAYRFYCGKDLENAHTASADTRATYEVLESQLERYGDALKTDINFLNAFTNQRQSIDFAGRLVSDDAGEAVVNFGKHRGKRLRDVYANERSYFKWVYEGSFSYDTKQQFYRLEKLYAEQAANAAPSAESLDALKKKFNSR